MRPFLQPVLNAALVLSVMAIGINGFLKRPDVPALQKESAYERVIRTGILRCGYFLAPADMMKDPNTNTLSGIGYDMTNAAAKSLNLNVEWVEEVTFATMVEGLIAGRYDAVCSSVWNRPALAQRAAFTTPFSYMPIATIVRANDTRFDADRFAINDAAIKIAMIDGENGETIAAESFPKATRHSLPQNADVSQMLEDVATGKADVAFSYLPNIAWYEKSHPGILRVIHTQAPIRAFGNTIMVSRTEGALRDMLNTAIDALLTSAEAERVLARYEPFPGAYYRVNRPYIAPNP